MKPQTKWKVGRVYWKLAKGQETKGGSKNLTGAESVSAAGSSVESRFLFT